MRGSVTMRGSARGARPCHRRSRSQERRLGLRAKLARLRGPRPEQRHLPPKHVEEQLWRLIDPGVSQEWAEPSTDLLVVSQRMELVQGKPPLPKPDPRLSEQRPFAMRPDERRHDQEGCHDEREEQEHPKQIQGAHGFAR